MATRVGHLAGRRVVAVDGKTMYRARTPAGVQHLVAASDHATGAVAGQLAIPAKSNEIPALRDPLDTIDITGSVITADAMHCQREPATHITDRDAHYVLAIKNNQPTLHAACKALPWTQVPAATVTDRRHGRRAGRTIKAVQAPDWIDFPGAAQIIQTPPNSNHHGTQDNRGRLRGLLTGRDRRQPATATWIQAHWGNRRRCIWVRDVTFDEDRRQLRLAVGHRHRHSLARHPCPFP